MTKDFADFLASLNREEVAYVVIGGIAVLAHIPYRTTRDLDVLIEPTLENAHRARRAVAAWGSFDPQYAAEEFIASFAGIDELIRMKRATGNPEKDLPDVQRLEIAQQNRDGETPDRES